MTNRYLTFASLRILAPLGDDVANQDEAVTGWGRDTAAIAGDVAQRCMGSLTSTWAGCPEAFESSRIRCLAILTIPASAQPGDANLAYWDITKLTQYDALYSICLTLMLMAVILIM